MKKQDLDALVNLCSRRGIVMPAFGIYGELSGFYDYGPIGVRIKHNIESAWRKRFIERMGNLEIESTIVGHEKVYDASGHLKTFTDPITTCATCKAVYRTDKLLEAYFSKSGKKEEADKVKSYSAEKLSEELERLGLKCEKCGSTLKGVTTFNLMLSSKIGPLGLITGYLRPETAQGIFVNFKYLYRVYGMKLPGGIGQAGKVFRNEISPRQILIRLREFSQMELELFFDPERDFDSVNGIAVDWSSLETRINFISEKDQRGGEAKASKGISIAECVSEGYIPNRLMGYAIAEEVAFLKELGFKEDEFRFRQLLKDELPHYSKGNVDLEVSIGNSWEEAAGNAYRTDFDLKSHQSMSNQDMSVVDMDKKVLPHVVEVSLGLDRIFWGLLHNSLYRDGKRDWDVLLLAEDIAPYKYALFPLQKDDKIIAKSVEIGNLLKSRGIYPYYSVSGSIGKRYAKADEVGIPMAITIDYETLENGTVTIRKALDGGQTRVKFEDIR